MTQEGTGAVQRRCGIVALVGRPNVGKSTLLNRMVGQKISIATPKPQTTRHRIIGVRTAPAGQIVLVDLPGLHRGGPRGLNDYMNRTARVGIDDADLLLWVIEAGQWRDDDRWVLEHLSRRDEPVGLVVNKVDRMHPKAALLPFIDQMRQRRELAFVVPVSALRQDNLCALEDEIYRHLPVGENLFAEEQVTDRPVRFLVAELIREQLTLRLQRELPYALSVEIERFEETPDGADIAAVIWVEKESQKGIVIGAGGRMLKVVGRGARMASARMLQTPVHLQLWVKVKARWPDSDDALRSLGYD